jgi:hypothetical protein
MLTMLVIQEVKFCFIHVAFAVLLTSLAVMWVNDPFFFKANVVYTFVITSDSGAQMTGTFNFALSIFGSTAVGMLAAVTITFLC